MKNNLLKTVIILLSVTFVTLQGCKKDKSLTEQKQIDPTEQKILNFKEQMKNPNKSDETLSIDSAVWYIEAALNYTYCDTATAVVGIDSIFVPVNITEAGEIHFNDIVNAYAQLNEDLISTLGENTLRVADIEFVETADKSGVEQLKLTVVKGRASFSSLSDLNYDWSPGPGMCSMGRCDGTHTDKSAATVWSKAITFSKGVPYNGYFTDVNPVDFIANSDNFTNPELDTMLYKGYFETMPCVDSADMHKYYHRGITISNRYNPPTGWGVAYVGYWTSYNGLPGKIWTELVVYGGEIHYRDPSEL